VSVLIAPPLIAVDTLAVLAAPQPADLAIGTDGELILTATGDLALVSGTARLVQDVWLLAVTPLGAALCDPTYGDGLAGLIGSRMPRPAQAQAAAAGLQNAITGLHAKRTAQGSPPGPDEGLAGVDVLVSTSGTTVTLDLTVTTQSGASGAASLPLTGV
jgi:hypothetical protein